MGKVVLTKDNRRLIHILLHYRHMFLYLMKHYPSEIDNLLEENLEKNDLKTSIEYCNDWFEKITSTSGNKVNRLNKLIIEFIQQTESSYGSHEKFVNIDLQKLRSDSKRIHVDKSKKISQKRKQTTTDSASSTNNKRNRPDSVVEVKEQSDHDDSSDSDENSTIDIFGMAMQYSCSFVSCRYRCTSQEKIKNHELLCHSGTTKVYKCSFKNCGGQFNSVYDLEKHTMKIHEIFKCSIGNCGSEFENE
ncbi:hypothetical protein BLA29_008921 [Euroglyphus maynei]|uniref:C2H2-type domain-containing protein n=1 Tax=Euroglyphus maynei TaxID=6958 RepID=A0A1Y3BSW4_EURMA|nr:hypothetical protein BLA29_008921 [Euroglyphus maynei]